MTTNTSLEKLLELLPHASDGQVALAVAYYVDVVLTHRPFDSRTLLEQYPTIRQRDPANMSAVLLSLHQKGALNREGMRGGRWMYSVSKKAIRGIEKELTAGGWFDADKKAEPGQLIGEVSKSLATAVATIPDLDERGYIEEALSCLHVSVGAYRAGVLMGWAATIDHLRRKIEQVGFAQFCSVYQRHFQRLHHQVQTRDDLEYYEDNRLLLVCQDLGIYDKAVKAQLDQALDLRNACAHPTMVKPGIHAVRKYFEDIINYVLSKP